MCDNFDEVRNFLCEIGKLFPNDGRITRMVTNIDGESYLKSQELEIFRIKNLKLLEKFRKELQEICNDGSGI